MGHVSDLGEFPFAAFELRLVTSRPFDEELDRFRGLAGIGVRRDLQTSHPADHFARDTDRLPRGHEDREPRAGREPLLGQLCAGRDQVLAVVQDHERSPGRQEIDHGRVGRGGPALLNPHRVRRNRKNELWIGNRRKVHEPDPVRSNGKGRGSRLDGKARLPATSRPGQRDEPGGFHELGELRHVAVPADETGDRLRQVVSCAGSGSRSGEVARKVGMMQLEQVLGLREVLEPKASDRLQ